MKNNIGILGYPIKHSLSPKIHNFWLKSMSINGKYRAISTPKKNLKNKINFLNNKGYKGLNLTIPHKENVLKFLDKTDNNVKITGAANTLIFVKKNKIKGKNTDIYGFEKAINKLMKNKKKENAMVLGGGGAARAVILVLIGMKYKKILIVNRTKKNATKIKKDFIKNFSLKPRTKIICEDLVNSEKFMGNVDVLINTTPLGMKGFPDLKLSIKNLKKNSAVFDLIYNPLETKLIKQAKKRGIKNTNGLDMLIYQAQKSFYHWFKKMPKINNKLKKLLEKEIN